MKKTLILLSALLISTSLPAMAGGKKGDNDRRGDKQEERGRKDNDKKKEIKKKDFKFDRPKYDKPTHKVPDGGMTLVLLGGSLAGFGLYRAMNRRNEKAS